MPRHANISVFVPHIGCPNMCSFCNQRHITGTSKTPVADDIDRAVSIAVNSKKYSADNTEIAFFGGSFTAIDADYMVYLLNAAYKYVENGTVCGIRVSTRPDAVNKEILDILKSFGVTAIELGAQSLSDDVLKLNNRGHTAKDVLDASYLIKEYGFSLGLQMMTGLYGSNDSIDINTAEQFIKIKPDTVRIYPTIVLKDTDLGDMFLRGIYNPQSLENAINLCSKLYMMFTENNINVIRLGLHTIEKEYYLSGPFHPAFSELCQSRILFNKAVSMLKEQGKYIIYVNKSDVSKMTGNNKSNIIKLKNLGFECVVKQSESLKPLNIIIRKAGE